MVMGTRDLRLSNCDLNIHSGLDGDVGDLLDHLGSGVKVEDALVDAHLPAVEGVGTFSTRGFTHNELQLLGGHSNGSGDL